ncbi:hypothetical protein NUW54_g73 [Trametes sanguinea]|uniref:Uncharacterized protein n=2 Tax=Trametes sanguinea TaxID=158606 RepID=A0ACC1Q3G0_9APHY|nr:hypothetical protein NUW54_g3060 [Trametes sanguinea]KAJ3019485.1 hypothetical protein NUW54_g73 [Trametes sanguinea]
MSAPILLYLPREVLPESESKVIPGPADEDEFLPKRMKRMTPMPMQVILKKTEEQLKEIEEEEDKEDCADDCAAHDDLTNWQ